MNKQLLEIYTYLKGLSSPFKNTGVEGGRGSTDKCPQRRCYFSTGPLSVQRPDKTSLKFCTDFVRKFELS